MVMCLNADCIKRWTLPLGIKGNASAKVPLFCILFNAQQVKIPLGAKRHLVVQKSDQ